MWIMTLVINAQHFCLTISVCRNSFVLFHELLKLNLQSLTPNQFTTSFNILTSFISLHSDKSITFCHFRVPTPSQHLLRIDCICIDYLDLLMPATKKVNPGYLFIKDKYVSEELRNFAVENNVLFATASQLNRSAVEEVEFDHSHISGGLSKIQTADNVIGIFTSQAMRERGRYQIQFMKTRSSSGVGQKVDLAFDIEGLRITDLPDDEQDTITNQSSTIYDKLKKKSTIVDSPNEPAPEATSTEDQAARLRSILRKQD